MSSVSRNGGPSGPPFSFDARLTPRLAVLVSVLVVAACGSEPEAKLPDVEGKVLALGCRQGQCAWARAVRLERVRAAEDGELLRLVTRRGTSVHGFDGEPPETWSPAVAVDWEPQDSASYAYCSTERPAYAFPADEGGLILHRLDLHDLAGYQISSARMYMRLCHGREFEGEPDAAVAALGYRAGTPSEQLEIASPDAIP